MIEQPIRTSLLLVLLHLSKCTETSDSYVMNGCSRQELFPVSYKPFISSSVSQQAHCLALLLSDCTHTNSQCFPCLLIGFLSRNRQRNTFPCRSGSLSTAAHSSRLIMSESIRSITSASTSSFDAMVSPI